MASEKEPNTQALSAPRQVSRRRRRRRGLRKYFIRVTFKVLRTLISETETVLGRLFLSSSFKNEMTPMGLKFFSSHELTVGTDLELQFDLKGQTSVMIRVMSCHELLPEEFSSDLKAFKYRIDAIFLADSVSNENGTAERLVDYSEIIWKYVKGFVKV